MDIHMIQNWVQIILLGVGSLWMLVWLFFALRYVGKFKELTDSINPKEYLGSFMYYIGFGVMDAVRYDVRRDASPKAVAKYIEIRGSKYAYYYYYVTLVGKITYIITLIPIGILLGALANQPLFAAAGVAVAILLVADFDAGIQRRVSDRRDTLLSELPQALSKLALLVRAGLPLRSAWARVAETGTGLLYDEMKITMQQIQRGGIPETEAYRDFAVRCEIKEIKKFSSMIVQNLTKGNEELAYYLKQMSGEMWEVKKQVVQRQGENAKSLLVIPTMLVFIGVLIIIMIPMASSFQSF